jgi:arginase
MGAGPERLVQAGIDRALAADNHRVSTTLIEVPRDSWTSEIATAFELMRRVAAAINGTKNSLPVVLAGNCITTIGALATYPPSRTGVVWFDAHADFNTPDTTATGFLDGTALSAVTGGSWRQLALSVPGFRPIPEENVCVVGARDLDPMEKRLLSASGVTTVSAAKVRTALPAALDGLTKNVDRVHVHIDLDVLDASVARANTYAVGGGLTVEDLEFAVSTIGRALPIAGITLSAYDPAGDAGGSAAKAAVSVVRAAVRAAQRG